MNNLVLSTEQIQKLVSENSYKIDPKMKFLSRCIDERYQEDVALSPLAIPGADAGELALLFSTAHAYGFELIGEKAYQILSDITDQHFFETVKRLGKDIPLYQVSFKDDGTFNIEEMGGK